MQPIPPNGIRLSYCCVKYFWSSCFQQWEPRGKNLICNYYNTDRVLEQFNTSVVFLKKTACAMFMLQSCHQLLSDKMYSICLCPYLSFEDKAVFSAAGRDRILDLGFSPVDVLNGESCDMAGLCQEGEESLLSVRKFDRRVSLWQESQALGSFGFHLVKLSSSSFSLNNIQFHSLEFTGSIITSRQ